MDQLDASTYDWLITIASSAISGLAMFMAGLFLGWVCWANSRRLAMEAERELEARGRLLADVGTNDEQPGGGHA